MFKSLKKIPQKEAVFLMTIDLATEFKDTSEGHFAPRKRYFTRTDKPFTYEEIKDLVIMYLEKDLATEIEIIGNLKVYRIQVRRTYVGSIELFFTILFNSYQLIAGVKDFFDSLSLIRETSDRFIRSRLNNQYDDSFSVQTSLLYPSPNILNELNYSNSEFVQKSVPSHFYDSRPQRGFYYYLLIMNMLLFAIIIYLVWNAVQKVYTA